ncbi:MAG: hypothetical protein M3548_03215 [Actinomycetota bacterium]|nr:hypothetical protein [Actinomycetota bacterium]
MTDDRETPVPDWLVADTEATPSRSRSIRKLGLIAGSLIAATAVTWAVLLAVDEPGVVVCANVPDGPPGMETLVHLVAGADC